MKIVIEYDEETGHASRAWAFPDDAVGAEFFAYARNTERLDCELVAAEDPVRQLLDWLLDRRPTEREEEANAYWHEGADPGRSVQTIHLPPTLEEAAEQEKASREATLAYLGKAMGASPAVIGKATAGKAAGHQDGDTGDPVNG